MNTRLLYTLPATVLALAALVLAIAGFMSTKTTMPAAQGIEKEIKAKEASAPEYRYLLATRALSSGEAITPDAFTTVLSNSVVPGVIRVDDAPFGKPVKNAVEPGELLTASKLESSSLLQRLVPQGYQALAIPVDDVSGVGGLLRPGDRVDVNASFRRSDKDEPAALQVLKDILVLAVRGVPQVGEALDDEGRRRNSTVVLAVPEDKVSALLLASAEGHLRLAAIATLGEKLAKRDNGALDKGASHVTKAVYMNDLFPSAPTAAPRRVASPPSTRVQVFEGSAVRNVYVR